MEFACTCCVAVTLHIDIRIVLKGPLEETTTGTEWLKLVAHLDLLKVLQTVTVTELEVREVM